MGLLWSREAHAATTQSIGFVVVRLVAPLVWDGRIRPPSTTAWWAQHGAPLAWLWPAVIHATAATSRGGR